MHRGGTRFVGQQVGQTLLLFDDVGARNLQSLVQVALLDRAGEVIDHFPEVPDMYGEYVHIGVIGQTQQGRPCDQEVASDRRAEVLQRYALLGAQRPDCFRERDELVRKGSSRHARRYRNALRALSFRSFSSGTLS